MKRVQREKMRRKNNEKVVPLALYQKYVTAAT